MSVAKHTAVKIISGPSTGEFMLGALYHPLAPLVHGAVVHIRETQSCRHPEAEKFPDAPISAIELIQLADAITFGGIKTQWVVAHWNETRTGSKEVLWESYNVFAQFGESDARTEFAAQHKLWKAHGYFAIKAHEAYVRERAIKKLADMARKRMATPTKLLTPDGGAKGLVNAQLSVLEAMMPRTVQAMRGRDVPSAVAAFDYESHYPLSMDLYEKIDFVIVRAYTRAELPTDSEIAKEVAACGLPHMPVDSIKKRRQKLDLHGRSPGPKPTPWKI